MIPYYILIGIPAIYCLFGNIYDRKQSLYRKSSVINLFFGWLTLLLMFRHIECGSDLWNYKRFFKEAVNSPFIQQYEPIEWGYYALESIIAMFTDSFQINLAILAVLAVYPIMWWYRKEAEIPYLTIILFATVAPFSMYFSGLRQTIAMAFIVPVYYFTRQKRMVRFLLTVLAAYFFHKSALILLLFYPVYHMSFSRRSLIWLLPLLSGVFVFNRQIFLFLLPLLGDRYTKMYSEITSTGAYSVLFLLIIFAVYSFALVRDKALEEDIVGLRNILLMTVGIQCFAPIHSIAMRMNYYFLLVIPILIPKIANRSSTHNRKIAALSVIVMCVGFTMLFFYQAYTDADILNVYPYIPFWEN